MGCSLNSPIFGVGIPSNLGLGLTVNPGESMEHIVNGDIGVQMNYRPHHEQFSKQLFNEAGGEGRYVDVSVLRNNAGFELSHILLHPFYTTGCLFSTSFTLHTSSIFGLQIGKMKA